MKRTLSIILVSFAVYTLQAQSGIEARLKKLSDVTYKEITTPSEYQSAWELSIKQPLDHNNPSAGYFNQRVFLTHKNLKSPTVICTEGYARPFNRMYELSLLLEANQIDVEHRYFGTSIPEGELDYKYLTLEQATADLHHIRELLGTVYKEKWVSTGISKGGQTTLFYRYLYPDDVTVSVPYVAPLNLALEEERIYKFLDTVGSDMCRSKILATQRRLLSNAEQVKLRLKWYTKGANLNFTYLDFDQAFEYAVLEYSFSFWQWGNDCAAIPAQTTPIDDLVEHFLKVSGMDFFADQSMKAYASHYYQAGMQMGYYSYNTKEFKDVLKVLPLAPNPSAIFMPDKMKIEYDNTLATKTYEWATTKGDRMIYINGGSDTWSATAVPESKDVDALWLTLHGKHHGNARIANMTTTERKKLTDALERWLNIKLN